MEHVIVTLRIEVRIKPKVNLIIRLLVSMTYTEILAKKVRLLALVHTTIFFQNNQNSQLNPFSVQRRKTANITVFSSFTDQKILTQIEYMCALRTQSSKLPAINRTNLISAG